jgi:hypothetical protein
MVCVVVPHFKRYSSDVHMFAVNQMYPPECRILVSQPRQIQLLTIFEADQSRAVVLVTRPFWECRARPATIDDA